MTKEELASKLTGREYTNEITKEEAAEAHESGLVVVFGASDDLCELRGAIDDEEGCYNGGTLLLDREGFIPSDRDDANDDDEMLRYLLRKRSAAKIEARWGESDETWWTYQTEIPHATFDIMEDGEVYCRGIVLSLSDLPEAPK